LLIVADGALEYLPFSVLRAGPQQRLLALDHEIVNLPSINAVTLIRREASSRPLASKPLAIIADPVFDEGDPRLKKATANAGPPVTSDARAMRDMDLVGAGGRIRRLPFTRREAEAIASLLPEHPMMALDFAANKETILGRGLGEYETVHFATHAFVHSEHPELSGLVLSLFNKNGERQDGFLRLNEIYNLHLTAKRVVLSACQTALGKQIRGDGLIGLTRGFMYAGASQVIATLWQVDDAASFEFMKLFYDEMLVHHRRAPSALRAAQEKMAARAAWKSPFYWAPFVVYGDWQN